MASFNTVRARDRSAALRLLPELYARALQLKDEGLDEAAMSERLNIPLEAVGPCIRVAKLMLARILNGSVERGEELNGSVERGEE